jgi:3-hydroxymyristoyl/3-hydroxydecanoyl-(acyl carrier protein) dehydratase
MSAARWHVPANHPAFAGHFPNRPIVPGVVLLDRVIQLIAAECGNQVVTIGSAKFLHPVGPDTTLDIQWTAGAGRNLRFDITSAGTVIATGTLTLAE